MSLRLIASATAALAALAAAVPLSADAAGRPGVDLHPLGTYETGIFAESAAEIVAHYPAGDRLLVVNAAEAKVEVLDAADPSAPTKLFDLQTTGVASADGSLVSTRAVANSVAVREDGLGVVAVENDPKTADGWLVFFDAAGDGAALGAVRVGALPDMVTITPDGSRAVAANEGEPATDYASDPEGSIAVVELPGAVAAPGQDAVRTADFHAFEGDALPAGVRVFGGRAEAGTGTPKYPVSENLEPEYVAVDQQSKTGYVTVQEANAVAVIDLDSATVTDLWPLGTVDHTDVAFDPSDRDDTTALSTWPTQSLRLPDAIAAYQTKGTTYLVTANEGDSRDWDAYSEEARVMDLGNDGLPPICEAVAASVRMTVAELQRDENLGRLKITLAQGLAPDGACYQTLYSFGGRGISIWTTDGQLVADTGDEFETVTAAQAPALFNSDHEEVEPDGRSDDKGPEPEGLTIGKVAGRTYAFVALERIGGVMVYDITTPHSPTFVQYVNNRDAGTNDGDLRPESVTFINGEHSPTGTPLIAVANEVSGSTTLYDVR